MYLTLNGDNIPNNGYVVISDIGTSNDETALLCNTNYLPGGATSGGNWYGPDGSVVGSFTSVCFVVWVQQTLVVPEVLE